MKDYEADIDSIGIALALCLGTILIHKEYYKPGEIDDVRATVYKAMKAQARLEKLLAAEFDGVAVAGAADDGN